MRQLLAISLLLVYLLTGSTLQQLQKTPVLLEHYREHQVLNQRITVLEFITIHYLSGSVKDADYTRDLQLPYKSAEQVSSASPAVFVPPSFAELVLRPPLLAKTSYLIFDDGSRPAQFLSSIWQPPKHC